MPPRFPKESGKALRLVRDGATQREIAERMSVPLTTVHSRIADGTEYLNKLAQKRGL
jgi:DNA-directed RNA polymerase specialized sigma24 family protein